jgi:hypothetical protein
MKVGNVKDFILWKYAKKIPLEMPNTIASEISIPALFNRDVMVPDSQ